MSTSTTFLTRAEVAALLRMSQRFVDYLIRDRKIEVVRTGRRTWVSAEAVEKYIASVTEPADLPLPEEPVRGRPRSR